MASESVCVCVRAPRLDSLILLLWLPFSVFHFSAVIEMISFDVSRGGLYFR